MLDCLVFEDKVVDAYIDAWEKEGDIPTVESVAVNYSVMIHDRIEEKVIELYFDDNDEENALRVSEEGLSDNDYMIVGYRNADVIDEISMILDDLGYCYKNELGVVVNYSQIRLI